jgi:hypothetical protein
MWVLRHERKYVMSGGGMEKGDKWIIVRLLIR